MNKKPIPNPKLVPITILGLRPFINDLTVLKAVEILSPILSELISSSCASKHSIYAAFYSSLGFTIKVRDAIADISQYFVHTFI